MGGIRDRSKPVKYDQKNHLDVMAEDLTEQEGNIDGSSSTSSFDRFCVEILGVEGSLMDTAQCPYWDGDASTCTATTITTTTTTSTSVESSPVGWPRTSREKSRLGKLHCLPVIINSKEALPGWEDKESKQEKILDASG